jgi:tRNA nucleotidyltransferase (CCA-adding enzyme)
MCRRGTVTQIRDLMSHGVHTVEAHQTIDAIVGKLRRIGHEGYPVVREERVVGLLTRRDLDRAAEYGLGKLHVHDVMQSGSVTLAPEDSVEALEQLIVQSGWGQIPVIDAHEKIIGIVTRTDLIKYWAQSRPQFGKQNVRVSEAQVEATLGISAARLIQRIAAVARDQSVAVYMVGGCVRDLLLKRQNLDLDFVVEGDAIAFAKAIQQSLLGRLSTHPPFGTAKWSPDAQSLQLLGTNNLPEHIDFASARNEFYEHPTALPTVYRGSIKLDLLRRDFTINTLAVQIAPDFGHILDFYGGLRDLDNRQIRVLHSLSFIDDPTRILRAVRFEQRLGFSLEERTASHITPALPMLSRITGERIRNELDLLFSEDQPENGLRRLGELGALAAIHPTLASAASLEPIFKHIRQTHLDDADLMPPLPQDSWLLLASGMTLLAVRQLCERLLIVGNQATLMEQTASLQQEETHLATLNKPSQVVALLDKTDVRVVRVLYASTEISGVKSNLKHYLRMWCEIHPETNGSALIALGLKPGPCFQRILTRLRTGLLDGEFQSDDEPRQVKRWIAEGICNDNVS